MPTYFQRPENALKRANEFIDVGKKQRALDALYDVIKSRRHRTWQKIHEPIMVKYLELCVELKKSHIAKEGLYQYKNISQQVNIKSLEDVVRGYLQLAEDKTEAARGESQQAVVDIDDLDNVQTPENLLLSAVSCEDSQDRTDRVVLTPWVKFLWESYRQCLELLRNNSRVERLYHDIAQQAFKFCLKYNRKTEFRKLCDNLRAHLDHIHKHQNQQTSVNLNNPESQAMHLETRLVQLESAIQMELWQEAYKAIEGIHGLMTLSKKPPKAQLMANYYQKLALVFWKAGNLLFHASALFRLFHLSREMRKNITSEEIQKMASRVVLATLSVPMPPNRPEIDRLVETDENVIDKNHRLLSTLLGLPSVPSRNALVKDLARFGVIQNAPSQIQDLYRWLEVDFHPLKLSSRVSTSFEYLQKWEEAADMKQYIPALQSITVMRLLKEVSQVYQTIEFKRLLELATFATPFYLENIVVEAARRNNLQVRLDHRKQCLHFGSELSVSQREETVEGPHLQGMPSEQIRNQLVQLHSVLHKAVDLIQPDKVEKQALREQIITAYHLTAQKEHRRLLERQDIIEARKQMLETLSSQKEEEERKILEEKQQKLKEAEEERMAKEAEERAKQRILREKDELKKKVVMEKIEALKKTELGARLFEGLEDEELERLDPEEIFSRQMEQMDRERKELQTKLRKQERKVDHLERAKRIEEIPLLKEAYEAYREDAKKFWEEEEKERIKQVIAEREYSLQHRDRILRMKEDKDAFLDNLRQARLSVYKKKISEFEKKLDEERVKRLAERKIQRKKDRREKWLEDKFAEELRKREEEKRKEDEIKKQQEEEHLAKLALIEQKQKAKLLEIEERERAERLEQERLREESRRSQIEKAAELDDWRKKPKDDTRDSRDGTVTLTKKTQGWREREQSKKESWGPKSGRDLSPHNEPLVRKIVSEEKSWRAKAAPVDEPAKESFSRGDQSEVRYQPPVRKVPEERWRKPNDDERRPDRDDAPRADRDERTIRKIPEERWRKSNDDERRSDRDDFRRPNDDTRRTDRDDSRRTDREENRRTDREEDRGMGGRDSGRQSYGDRNYGGDRDRQKRNFGDSDRDRGGFGSRDFNRGGESSFRGGGGGGYNKDRNMGDDKGRAMKPPPKERSEENSWRREAPRKEETWSRDTKPEAPKREKAPRSVDKNDGDDGWTTVSKQETWGRDIKSEAPKREKVPRSADKNDGDER